MIVQFESATSTAAPSGALVQRRLQSSFRRLARLVSDARIALSELSEGGRERTRWRIELRTATAGTLVIVALGRDWRAGLDRALSGATRALQRVRRLQLRRQVSSPAPLALIS